MLDEQYWAIYFAGIAAIKMHPKNDRAEAAAQFAVYGSLWDTQRVQDAARIADEMLAEHKRRFPKCGEQ